MCTASMAAMSFMPMMQKHDNGLFSFCLNIFNSLEVRKAHLASPEIWKRLFDLVSLRAKAKISTIAYAT